MIEDKDKDIEELLKKNCSEEEIKTFVVRCKKFENPEGCLDSKLFDYKEIWNILFELEVEFLPKWDVKRQLNELHVS